ncbi:hypothetical protein TNCT_242321 [Trichonephila clavata]|uniref:Reverse transcriptase domain-containing protein n=1 Tax=Trichonephila clavata TaxID=2740835 RepID=A0A8X6EYK1_TRICU|nr:hypothetical protein TNCT_242321 [Trichonephila clavata]
MAVPSLPSFSISFEQVLRPKLEVDTEEYSLFRKSHRCLAYADDLILIDKSRGSLQILLDFMVLTAARIGLKFNPLKCASFAFHHSRNGRIVNDVQLLISGTSMPSLTDTEAYKCLVLKVVLNYHITRLFDAAGKIF